MASGEVNIDRRIDRDPRLAPGRDLVGVPLGIRSRELAPRIAGAGDEASPQCIRPGAETERVDRRAGRRDLIVRYAGDQEILPDREADIAVAISARHRRDSP